MDVQQNGSMTVITDTVGCVLILKTREHGCETVAFRTAIAAGEADCQSIDGRISGPCLRQRERDFLHSNYSHSVLALFLRLVTSTGPDISMAHAPSLPSATWISLSVRSSQPVGEAEGTPEGEPLGPRLGDAEGVPLGDSEGLPEGDALGLELGLLDGEAEGEPVGEELGFPDGLLDGDAEGEPVGPPEGAPLARVCVCR